MKIRIASRESRLALWQAEHVRALLLQQPEVTQVDIVGMTTLGDRILDRSLSKIGGKGLFIKELEHALLEGRADLAVHSGKDIPMQLEQPFQLLGFMTRENPLDAFVSNDFDSLESLPAGAVVGTSSLRRQAQLLARFPHLNIEPLRGNLDTRLAKLDAGDYQAIVLAAAGLKRLGLSNRIRAYIQPDLMLPAVGQGALGLEIHQNHSELAVIAGRLVDPVCTQLVNAERLISRELGGSCQVPLAGYATLNANHDTSPAAFCLQALVASACGQRVIRHQAQGLLSDFEAVAHEVLALLKQDGATELMQQALAVSAFNNKGA